MNPDTGFETNCHRLHNNLSNIFSTVLYRVHNCKLVSRMRVYYEVTVSVVSVKCMLVVRAVACGAAGHMWPASLTRLHFRGRLTHTRAIIRHLSRPQTLHCVSDTYINRLLNSQHSRDPNSFVKQTIGKSTTRFDTSHQT